MAVSSTYKSDREALKVADDYRFIADPPGLYNQHMGEQHCEARVELVGGGEGRFEFYPDGALRQLNGPDQSVVGWSHEWRVGEELKVIPPDCLSEGMFVVVVPGFGDETPQPLGAIAEIVEIAA